MKFHPQRFMLCAGLRAQIQAFEVRNDVALVDTARELKQSLSKYIQGFRFEHHETEYEVPIEFRDAHGARKLDTASSGIFEKS